MSRSKVNPEVKAQPGCYLRNPSLQVSLAIYIASNNDCSYVFLAFVLTVPYCVQVQGVGGDEQESPVMTFKLYVPEVERGLPDWEVAEAERIQEVC